MATKEYQMDTVARELAEKLVGAYQTIFEGVDVDNIGFIRIIGKKPSKAKGKLYKVGWPYEVYMDKYYVMEIDGAGWDIMSEQQQAMLIFHELLHVPDGGCDPQSKNHRKIRKHDVEDFSECLIAADMNLDWAAQGEKIENIFDRATKRDEEKEIEDELASALSAAKKTSKG